MATFPNMSELKKFLEKHIQDTLSKEVAKQVKEEIQVSVDETVYQSGTPEYYDRRGGNAYGGMGNPIGTGSLADQNEMTSKVNGLELTVTDDAKSSNPWDKNLAEAIEYGYGSGEEWYNQPRPFMENAVENMKNNKNHVYAMKEGLEKRLGKGTVI